MHRREVFITEGVLADCGHLQQVAEILATSVDVTLRNLASYAMHKAKV